MSPTISSTQSFIAMIKERQNALQSTDDHLSKTLGFQNPKTLSQIKQGVVKFPLAKITALAQALTMDAAMVLRSFMTENMPEVLTLMDSHLVNHLQLTPTEVKLIESCRALSAGRDVVPKVLDGNAVVALVVA